jgi:cytosine permease
MNGLMNRTNISLAQGSKPAEVQNPVRRWTGVAGAWLGIGTAPGALLLGAGIAERYNGPIPLLSVLISLALMLALLWFQGLLGMAPPYGEGRNLTALIPSYFGALMQRIVAGLIALGMIGWFGFNVGLGGAALSALLHWPAWTGPVIIGTPILLLSLKGMSTWNGLASLTTIAVLVLVALVVALLAARESPVSLAAPTPPYLVIDAAAFIGYISVFSVRSPDFTAGLRSRKDLLILELLLCVPIIFIALAGVGLHRGTGSADLVSILAGPGGLAIGNLLITISVIAPTFTTLYSGAPALKASIGIPPNLGMIAITIIGLTLAILRFDQLLLSWLVVLSALLPPLIIPLAVESTHRRHGHPHRQIPILVWLPGALVSMGLTFAHQPLAPLIGLVASLLVTLFWHITAH